MFERYLSFTGFNFYLQLRYVLGHKSAFRSLFSGKVTYPAPLHINLVVRKNLSQYLWTILITLSRRVQAPTESTVRTLTKSQKSGQKSENQKKEKND